MKATTKSITYEVAGEGYLNCAKGQLGAETPKAPSKKLKVILFGQEVANTHTEAILELPVDAIIEEIQKLGGSELESMLWETSEYVEWIPGDVQSQITFEEVVVEPCLEDEEPDLCLVRDEAGELVLEKPK
jgi:hypothetical protein